MREDLIGYLLGALEPHEMEQVEAALRDDPELRTELENLRAAMLPLRKQQLSERNPPADLRQRTMKRIADASGPTVGQSGPDPIAVDSGSIHRIGWPDLIAGFAAVAILLGLVFPGLLHSRFQARKLSCQDNLRQMGVAVATYAMRDPQQQLPPLAAEGPEAFAGMYALRLNEAGLLESLQALWCPSLDRPQWLPRELPATAELHRLQGAQLNRWQRASGGSYGYSLGVMDDGRYRSARFSGRSHFAILGDAVVYPEKASPHNLAPACDTHDGKGVNLLFEDGRVRFVTLAAIHQLHDHPFLNQHGHVEAGIHVNDAAIAPSWQSPFRRQ